MARPSALAGSALMRRLGPGRAAWGRWLLPGSPTTGKVGAIRTAAAATAEAKPTASALALASRKLREAVQSHDIIAKIAADADASVDTAAVLERLARELAAGESQLDVLLAGEVMAPGSGRRSISVPTPTGPSGGPAVRKVTMNLPSAEDMSKLLSSRKEQNLKAPKPEELAGILQKFLEEKYYGKRSDHVALIAAWGPKAIGDAVGEFGEVGALMDLQLKTHAAVLKSGKEDFQFELQRVGDGKDCLVMPPSNFALLGLKDLIIILLQGYRVLMVVQPRFLPHYREIQSDLLDCGLPSGLLDVLPGITPEADPAALHETLRHVDRLQFTGSSAMFRGLVAKAYELGNLQLEHGGEVSGLNKVRLEGVSASHPAAAAGAAWAALANNGELCTSASIVEFDPSTGDTAASVKAAMEAHPFRMGRDPASLDIDVLLKDGKTESLEVKTELPAEGFREWWEKAVLAVPRGGQPQLATSQSLGHCIYAKSIKEAVALGVQEDASCLYLVGVPSGEGAPSPRAGTTGCKLPESVFGGMKTHTFAVGGDHDGVGSVQTLLSTAKRRGANWRDQEEARNEYQLTEAAEMLLEFLSPRDQEAFQRTISSVLDVFAAFEPEVSRPYPGQALVGGEGHSKLVTLAALRPTRKRLLIPQGVSLPEEIVKVAALCEMSPLRELPVDVHLLGMKRAGKLQVTDPLKSFLRVVEKNLKWRLHWHEDMAELLASLRGAEYPPYFYCVKDRRHLPPELLSTVVECGGYLYEGLPTDALSLFRWATTTQAWTVACTEEQVGEAVAELQAAWKAVGLREAPHDPPELLQATSRRGGDYGAGLPASDMDFDNDKEWADAGEESSSDEEEIVGGKATAAEKKVESGGVATEKSPSGAQN